MRSAGRATRWPRFAGDDTLSSTPAPIAAAPRRQGEQRGGERAIDVQGLARKIALSSDAALIATGSDDGYIAVHTRDDRAHDNDDRGFEQRQRCGGEAVELALEIVGRPLQHQVEEQRLVFADLAAVLIVRPRPRDADIDVAEHGFQSLGPGIGFAVGFLMRPIGGWLFGIIADRDTVPEVWRISEGLIEGIELLDKVADLAKTDAPVIRGAVLWALQAPPPLAVIAAFVALTWVLQRRVSTLLLVLAGFLYILNQGYWEETTESLTLVLAACAGGGGGGEAGGDVTSVKIGFMGDLTGENAAIVIPPRNGAVMAVEEYNAKNPKVKIELVQYDSQGKAQKVFYNFTKLAAADSWADRFGYVMSVDTASLLSLAGERGGPEPRRHGGGRLRARASRCRRSECAGGSRRATSRRAVPT